MFQSEKPEEILTSNTIIVATTNSTQRNSVAALIEKLPDFEVIARTGDLMNTYNQVEARMPTAVLISDSLANLAEFEVMRALFSSLDVRWLVLTAPGKAHKSTSFDTLGSDLFSVPGDADAKTIEGQLRSLTRSSPYRKPAISQGRKPALASITPHPKSTNSKFSSSIVRPNLTQPEPRDITHIADTVILIGASTGGVDALLSVLSCFPRDCPPTLVVQHTGSGFGESLSSLLNRQCAATVALAKDPQPLRRGTILIGAGTRTHLVFKNGTIPSAECIAGSQMSGHMPSVDMLFKSAVGIAPRITAAILTGMGKDGAEGLLELRKAGAATYAQDEASSVIFGMPRAAIEIGAAQKTLPLGKIGPALLRGPNIQGRHSRRVLS